ncbi:MAG TPA: aspartate-semialdehyde dehydrogenase [Rhizomicrobium sp.]|nr:aspartate-semialdehyde dehydrogenase [Rhizomicrobium sp.]
MARGYCRVGPKTVSFGLHKGLLMSESKSLYRQLQGQGLATASVLYRMPDYPAILQTYIWQEYDLAPHFPELHRFLDFWTHSLDGLLHTVTVAHTGMFKPTEIRLCGGEWRLH